MTRPRRPARSQKPPLAATLAVVPVLPAAIALVGAVEAARAARVVIAAELALRASAAVVAFKPIITTGATTKVTPATVRFPLALGSVAAALILTADAARPAAAGSPITTALAETPGAAAVFPAKAFAVSLVTPSVTVVVAIAVPFRGIPPTIIVCHDTAPVLWLRTADGPSEVTATKSMPPGESPFRSDAAKSPSHGRGRAARNVA